MCVCVRACVSEFDSLLALGECKRLDAHVVTLVCVAWPSRYCSWS